MIQNCKMRHENGNCSPAGGFCTANKNICEALQNAYEMGQRNAIANLPPIDAVQVVRCEDCLFGHLCFDVQNGVTDSWVDCRNPEGLYRDVSLDGYCSASIRRK